jgi:hypothetical protein
MKKLQILSMLFFSLNVQAQIDTTEGDLTGVAADSVEMRTIGLPDSTAIGKPDGKLVSKEISSAGGTIISDDGRVELIFPAGTLTKETNISIQPITNLLPNGNGKGYQFEPSGTRFIKPVEIIFHYSQGEDEVCTAPLHFMAIQDKNGKWEYADYEDWDSTTRSLKGHISHFSAMVDGNLVELKPDEITLRVGSKKSFYLEKVEPPQQQQQESRGSADDDLPPRLENANVSSTNKRAYWWAKLGRIAQQPGSNVKAIYNAPKFLPHDDSDQVKLTLETVVYDDQTARLWNKKGKRSRVMEKFKATVLDKVTFAAKVQLYDEYKVSIKYKGEARTGGQFENDKGSFVVKITNGAIIIDDHDIENFPPEMSGSAQRKGPFKQTMSAGPSCVGSVDISQPVGKESYLYSATNAPREITLKFDQHEVLAYQFITNDKKNSVGAIDMKKNSIPGDIHFTANGKRQQVEKPNAAGMGTTIDIIPVRD